MAEFEGSPADNVDCNIVSYKGSNSCLSPSRIDELRLHDEGDGCEVKDASGAVNKLSPTHLVPKTLGQDRGSVAQCSASGFPGGTLRCDNCGCALPIGYADSICGGCSVGHGSQERSGSTEQCKDLNIPEKKKGTSRVPDVEGEEKLNEEKKAIEAYGVKILDPSLLQDCKYLASGNRSLVKSLHHKEWEAHCAKVFYPDKNSDETDFCFKRMLAEASSLQIILNITGVPKMAGVTMRPYAIVMTRHGDSLSTWLRTCNTPPFFLLVVLLKTAIIVRSVHALGYTHNDIKNDNICVKLPSEDGMVEVTVIDWGLMTKIGKPLWPEHRRNRKDAVRALEDARRRSHRNIAPYLYHGGASLPSTDAYAMAVLIHDLKERIIKNFENDGLSRLVDAYLCTNGGKCCMEKVVVELQQEIQCRNKKYFDKFKNHLTEQQSGHPNV
ncbi:uncharacterized protein LOC135220770 [Macrobrachium nipponense]|uniref:uncharacterized protein LOC135220770 n=1 Tax=Macrobrachium nipponense TaxID=159736 RepID=UPI0030C7D87E